MFDDKRGIDELKDVIKFGLSLAEGFINSVADGQITLFDGIHFKDAIVDLPDAIENIDEVFDEICDLDESEIEELKEFVEKEFEIPYEKTEKVIELALGLVLSLIGTINEIRK